MGEDGVFISKQGKINFVDLAGSEMTKKTQSEGKTLEEANNINKSLMVLGMYFKFSGCKLSIGKVSSSVNVMKINQSIHPMALQPKSGLGLLFEVS
jgi:hypothetical protein